MLVRVNKIGFQGQALEYHYVDVEDDIHEVCQKVAFRIINGRCEKDYNELVCNTAIILAKSIRKVTKDSVDILIRMK